MASTTSLTVDLSLTWQGVLPVLLRLLTDGNSVGVAYARTELERMAKCADLATDAVNELTPNVRAAPPNVERLGQLLWRASELQRNTATAADVTPKAETPIGQLASQAGKRLPVQVCCSGAGYYVGTHDEQGLPFSRESAEYWPTAEAAESALADGTWSQRTNA